MVAFIIGAHPSRRVANFNVPGKTNDWSRFRLRASLGYGEARQRRWMVEDATVSPGSSRERYLWDWEYPGVAHSFSPKIFSVNAGAPNNGLLKGGDMNKGCVLFTGVLLLNTQVIEYFDQSLTSISGGNHHTIFFNTMAPGFGSSSDPYDFAVVRHSIAGLDQALLSAACVYTIKTGNNPTTGNFRLCFYTPGSGGQGTSVTQTIILDITVNQSPKFRPYIIVDPITLDWSVWFIRVGLDGGGSYPIYDPFGMQYRGDILKSVEWAEYAGITTQYGSYLGGAPSNFLTQDFWADVPRVHMPWQSGADTQRILDFDYLLKPFASITPPIVYLSNRSRLNEVDTFFQIADTVTIDGIVLVNTPGTIWHTMSTIVTDGHNIGFMHKYPGADPMDGSDVTVLYLANDDNIAYYTETVANYTQDSYLGVRGAKTELVQRSRYSFTRRGSLKR